MTAYKTPGVYVEEIVKFPPSVAQVETAIPAFIGYTEKAKKKEEEDLIMKPTRITSMLEYEVFFGYGEKEESIEVNVKNVNTIDEEIIVTNANPSPFKMYYHMQMYFANGGGPCYIMPVGTYSSARSNNNVAPVILAENSNSGFMGLKDGLTEIEKVDEVTLIVFPDATSMNSADEFYGLYNDALNQCNKLQDRFTIIDTYSDTEFDGNDPIDDIRNKITSVKDDAKYGAIYYPFLNTILDYAYDESSIEVKGLDLSLSIVAAEVVNDIELTDLVTLLQNIVTAKLNIDTAVDNSAALAYKGDAILSVQNVIGYLEKVTNSINSLIKSAEDSEEASLTATITAMNLWMDSNLEDTIANLHSKLFKLQQDDTKAKLQGSLDTNTNSIYKSLGITDESDMANNSIYTDLDSQKKADELFGLKSAIDSLGVVALPSLADLKLDNNALYNKIRAEIGILPVKLSPSATMAGIYAKVDTDRGVWKAPANVSLNYVIEPSVQISHEQQQDLNVHLKAGKSINAIRTFVGKGTLVWGARTLTGNDNEWRYVSVRRFFNMAEESIKKATEQFVFEPNDKNTWVRVKAMIDNFLTKQWRAGALAGPTPDKAFYVSVGLGETMTAQDILEGNMIVEIGMAVVRPAEFIILKFSHKMQEA